MRKHVGKLTFFIALGAGILWIVVRLLTSHPAPLLPANSTTGFDVIAHRGGRGIAPENTLIAFETSNRLGVDVLEMDIRMTKDRQLVVIHDATVNRTTNGKGRVETFSVKELQTLDAAYYYSPDPAYNNSENRSVYAGLPDNGSLFPLRGKGIRIPLLSEVFKNFPDERMIIEIKPKSDAIIDTLCQTIRDFHMEDRVIVGSYHPTMADLFREECPGVATSASPRDVIQFALHDKVRLTGMITPAYVALLVPPKKKTKLLFGLHPTFTITSRSMIRSAHQKRLLVHVWTINTPEEMKRLQALGVDGIITDYPDKMLKMLGR